jgi:hypothetical protein
MDELGENGQHGEENEGGVGDRDVVVEMVSKEEVEGDTLAGKIDVTGDGGEEKVGEEAAAAAESSNVAAPATTLEDAAAIVIQKHFRRFKAHHDVTSKRLWRHLKSEATPLMKARVAQLRSVYDKSLLTHTDGTSKAVLPFSKQMVVVFLTPVVLISLWLCFPIAAYGEVFTDAHYVNFLLYWYIWMLSAVFFFFSLFSLVVSIPLREQAACAAVFALSCVGVHAVIFFSKGGTAFVNNCLDASMLHLAITSWGLIQFLWYIGLKIYFEIKHAELALHEKKIKFVEKRLREGASRNKVLRTSLSALAEDRKARRAQEVQHRIMEFATKRKSVMDRSHQEHVERIKRKVRRPSLLVQFDEEAQIRVSVASKAFMAHKIKHSVLTTLSIVWCALFFWCLSVYSAFFVTHASDPSAKGLLTIVFHALTQVFQVIGEALAEEADVVALGTQNPGHALAMLRSSSQYDNYNMWRLSHRMTVALIAFKRSFYMLLFAEAGNLASFVSMGFASLVATIAIQAVVSSQVFHLFIAKHVKRRTYASMGKEYMLKNLMDGCATVLYFVIFTIFFLIAKGTENKHVYPFRQHSDKPWDLLGFLAMYTGFTVLGCLLYEKYLERVIPGANEKIDLPIIFCLQDKRLYLAIAAILVHVGMDPYYSVSLTNLSRQLPCDSATNSTG